MSSARSAQKFGGKNNKKKKNNMKRGNSDYDAFPSCEVQVAFGNIVPVCCRFASFADVR